MARISLPPSALRAVLRMSSNVTFFLCWYQGRTGHTASGLCVMYFAYHSSRAAPRTAGYSPPLSASGPSTMSGRAVACCRETSRLSTAGRCTPAAPPQRSCSGWSRRRFDSACLLGALDDDQTQQPVPADMRPHAHEGLDRIPVSFPSRSTVIFSHGTCRDSTNSATVPSRSPLLAGRPLFPFASAAQVHRAPNST
jgi:hypothetical protein